MGKFFNWFNNDPMFTPEDSKAEARKPAGQPSNPMIKKQAESSSSELNFQEPRQKNSYLRIKPKFVIGYFSLLSLACIFIESFLVKFYHVRMDQEQFMRVCVIIFCASILLVFVIISLRFVILFSKHLGIIMREEREKQEEVTNIKPSAN
jgi:hypothetical protein